MIIDIQGFQGIAPSVSERLLPDGMATKAINCRLGSGEIRPIAAMLPVHYFDAEVRSIFRHAGTWLGYSDAGRRFVPSPVSGDSQKLYMTLAAGGAYVVNGDDTYKLGVKAPASAPSCSASGGSGTAETRTYLYTCVDELGEESAPSPASSTVDVLPGGTVSLTGLSTPTHDGYAPITKKRIYRSAVGTSGASAFLFVAEIDEGDDSYSDTVDTGSLGEGLPSLGWLEPPADLSGLTSVQGGVLAGFSGRQVRLCEPWYPYAWPDAYSNTVEYDIVQIAASGRTLFIFTAGPVYSMTVDEPGTAIPERLPGQTPVYGGQAVFETPYGVMFASREGLFRIASGEASPTLVTAGFFDQPEWSRLGPGGMFGAWCAGRLYIFYRDIFGATGGLVMAYSASGVSFSQVGTLPDAVVAAADSERLFVSVNGVVYEWEGDDSYALWSTWRSKRYVTPSPVNFGAAIVEAIYSDTFRSGDFLTFAEERFAYLVEQNSGSIGGSLGSVMVGEFPFSSDLFGVVSADYEDRSGVPSVVFRLYLNGALVYQKTVYDSNPFPLPALAVGREWALEVSGLYPVQRIAVAENMGELYP